MESRRDQINCTGIYQNDYLRAENVVQKWKTQGSMQKK